MSSSRPNTTKGYDQKQLEQDEIRKKLEEKRAMLEETKVESKLNAVSSSSSKHLQTIKESIIDALGDTQSQLHVKYIHDIKKEADTNIEGIKEMRQKQIGHYEVKMERERKLLKDKTTKLSSCVSDTDEIRKIVSEKISYLNSKIQDAIKDIKLSIIYVGKWERVKSINMQSVVIYPCVRGLVSDDEICAQDGDSNDMYVTNINTQHTEKVIDGGALITSCAPIESNVIVCGKERDDCAGDRLDGCITLYDRQWKVIRDISIPMSGVARYCSVCVDVDRDGMIIAGQLAQSNIYVINPATDKIINTITMQSMAVWGEIQALSSGDIVVKTGIEYTVISRSGEKKTVINCDESKWGLSVCRVDKLTDTLYITYWDRARNTHDTIAVDQVSRDGIIQARRIVEYVKSDRTDWFSPCLVTPSGNLVGCDGYNLHLYRKAFIL
ncbi:uncharacterized protein LOC121416471 [Lytechinus variegatus]|uniref:uncharacterized protein LOC121416471 n=1 Tax=Lytechinus variegatus TaxID=7654 RepID=UPI001BB15D7E|nr:uncharacterized protein LOC121416471 [Lytechinus variegatus]